MKLRNGALSSQRMRSCSLQTVPMALVRAPAVFPIWKSDQDKRVRQEISLRILQLKVEGFTACELDIVERLALERNMTIIVQQETYCQIRFLRRFRWNQFSLVVVFQTSSLIQNLISSATHKMQLNDSSMHRLGTNFFTKTCFRNISFHAIKKFQSTVDASP